MVEFILSLLVVTDGIIIDSEDTNLCVKYTVGRSRGLPRPELTSLALPCMIIVGPVQTSPNRAELIDIILTSEGDQSASL